MLVPMAGLIDPAAETERLAKRLAKADQELAKPDGQARQRQFRGAMRRRRSWRRSASAIAQFEQRDAAASRAQIAAACSGLL